MLTINIYTNGTVVIQGSEASLNSYEKVFPQLKDEAEKEKQSVAEEENNTQVALLMDSNGMFIDTRKLFPGQTVSTNRCSNTARALQLLDRCTLGSPHCIIIHMGTNDLSTLQHNTTRAVRRVAEKAAQEFPDARGCAALPNVHLAHHPTLTPWDLYDGLHLDRESREDSEGCSSGPKPNQPPSQHHRQDLAPDTSPHTCLYINSRPRLGHATLPGPPPHHNVSPGHPLQAQLLTNSSTVMLQLWPGHPLHPPCHLRAE
ncbi:hypothetical protein SKAU_G00078190 [Synaphobranchus kaupii]|uniref:Uncharacterized protein n=1 Tax=Synaphobranchus kaupii TaxID=118154 RepID=A0A9Q1FV40_SYNKA|nr:hypothetical protein SKAU_G00078190 [Synaphobranchus kaupii]